MRRLLNAGQAEAPAGAGDGKGAGRRADARCREIEVPFRRRLTPRATVLPEPPVGTRLRR